MDNFENAPQIGTEFVAKIHFQQLKFKHFKKFIDTDEH
jgi:hypothetical protein